MSLRLLSILALIACAPDPPPAPVAPPSTIDHLERARTHFQATRFAEAAAVARQGLALDSTAVDLLNIASVFPLVVRVTRRVHFPAECSMLSVVYFSFL